MTLFKEGILMWSRRIRLQLDTQQINNLCTGVKLAAELRSGNPKLRKKQIQLEPWVHQGMVLGQIGMSL